MKITKGAILDSLKKISLPGEGENIIERGLVSNIMIFGDQIDLDIQLENPSLQAVSYTHLTLPTTD